MTATEVNARFDLMQRLLGPVFGRLQTDLLDPMIERTFRILLRGGQLPQMPDVLMQQDEDDLEIDYVGPMARAQKSDMIENMTQWMGMMGEMGQLFPELNMLPDAQSFGRELGKAMNVPAVVIRSKEEVDKEIKAKQQQAIEQRQIEMAMGQGEAMQKAGAGAKSAAEAGIPVQ